MSLDPWTMPSLRFPGTLALLLPAVFLVSAPALARSPAGAVAGAGLRAPAPRPAASLQEAETAEKEDGRMEASEPASDSVYMGRLGQLQVSPPRLEEGDVSVDGRLDEPAWRSAPVLTGFTQYEPNEAIRASQETEVRVFYTSEAIYFGIRALDGEPQRVRATRTERDASVRSNDWVRIMLDTFDDQRRAYTFFVNPLGIQTDAIWLEELEPLGSPTGPKVDFNPDYVWDSEGRVTSDGWVAEIRIPYLSLRFPERSVQDWGLQIARGVNRTGFKSSWAPLTLNITNVLAQSGRLVGLRGIEPKRLVEFTPVFTGQRTGERIDGTFTRDGVDPAIGLDARVGITSNLVLDGTVNPDFSQVEADVDRIEVNERFALFFPEKRAFFLDGTEIFQTNQRLVHTRQIVDPIAGVKLTGKVGDFSLGYLGSVDESPSTLGEFDHEDLFNLVRARRDLGEGGSTLGFLFTDRSSTDGAEYNRVASSDLRLLFGERYSLETQLTGSWTRDRGAGGDASLKPFVTTNFRRDGQTFSFGLTFEDVHPEFRTRSGFVPRVGDTEVTGQVQFTRFRPAGSFLERYGLEIRTNNFFRHEAFWDGEAPFEYEVELWPRLDFRNDRSVAFVLRNGWFTFQPDDFEGYATEGPEGEVRPFQTPEPLRNILGLGVLPDIRVNDEISLGGALFFREIPIFFEGSKGRELQLSPQIQYRPTPSLEIDLSHTFSRIWRSEDDSRFSTVNISRIRTQFHFTEVLRARVIGQWDLEERSDLRDPTTGGPVRIGDERVGPRDRGGFLTQLLLAYEPSPGRVIFLGYSRTMQGDYSYSLSRMDAESDGLFLKLSYLFRM